MTDVTEPVFIQAFIAKASVKLSINPFCVGLPGWKSQLHAMLKGPLIECAAGKFGPDPFLSSPDSRETAQCCPEYA
jgi:hypothetical protein